MRQALIIVFMLAIACARSACAQPGATPRARTLRPVVRVTLSADLDTMRAARELDRTLAECISGAPDTIVFEVSGDRWRMDVVHAIAGRIRSRTEHTTVWLRDARDHRVGAGEAMLGLIADECWIDPGTRVTRRTTDDRHELAPKGTDMAQPTDELLRWSAERRAARGGRAFDVLLPRLLVGGMAPMWAAADKEKGPMRLVPAEPSAPRGRRVCWIDGPGAPAVEIDAEVAVDAGLAAGRAKYLAQMFAPRGVLPSIVADLRVEASLERIVAGTASSIAAIDREIDSIDADLGSQPRDQRTSVRSFYQSLAARGLQRLAEAHEQLAACERDIADDPEVLRTPAPDSTALDADPDSYAAAWRKALQHRRDRITRLERKARGLAAR